MPNEIQALTNNLMANPDKIVLRNEQLTLEGIRQYLVESKEELKLETFLEICNSIEISEAIIYCNSKKNVEFLTEEMNKKGFKVSSIHIDLPVIERDRIMNEFRKGVSRILITTDLFARGIDVHQVRLVINYDLPLHKEIYIHRIGRSGCFGRKGYAINFVTAEEKDKLEQLQKFYNTTIDALPSDLSEIK
jgi:superfamily II DNA/RNA helicase